MRETAQQYALSKEAVAETVAPYEEWIRSAGARDDAETALTGRARLAIALLALANQERALVLEAWSQRTAPAGAIQVLLRNADALIEGARAGGRLGYRRAAKAALSFRLGFRAAYQLYKRFGMARFLSDRLGERFEVLLFTRLLITELIGFTGRRLHPTFGSEIAELTRKILSARLIEATAAVEALRNQYPDHATALETQFLRQSASRREMGRYQALFEEGLIAREIYDDLCRSVDEARRAEHRPRFDLGLDTAQLIGRLDLLSGLDKRQLARVGQLLRPRFAVPNEIIFLEGERANTVLPLLPQARSRRCGFQPAHPARQRLVLRGEMALADAAAAARADVVRLDLLPAIAPDWARSISRKFMAKIEARHEINRVAQARLEANRQNAAVQKQ